MEENSQLIIDAAIKKGQLILQRADEKAEAIIAEAKLKAASETERILTEAKQKAEKEDYQLIINSAIQKGQFILQRANEKADAIIAEAKLKATSETSKMLDEVRQKAESEAHKIVAEAKNRAEMMTLIIRQEAQQLEHATSSVLTTESPAPQTPVSVKTKPVIEVTKGQTLNGLGEYIVNTNTIPYQGIVELVVLPPASPKQLFGFLLSLRKIPRIKVLHFKERGSGGFTVKLTLQTTAPLLNILSGLPEVQRASERLVKAGQQDAAQPRGEEPHQKTIEVRLKS